MVAVAKKTRRRAATVKTFSGGNRSATVDSSTTDSAMLLESWADVDAQDESGDDMQADAAGQLVGQNLQ